MRKGNPVLWTAALLAGLLLSLPALSAASGLQVTPLRVHLDEDTPAAALTLRNHGDRSRVIQTEVVHWTQEEGEDIHAPTDEVLVTPPIFTVEPGESQVVRVAHAGRNADSTRAVEQAYRIYLQESPPPTEGDGARLQVILRLGVPLFVAPEGGERPDLRWTVHALESGGLEIRAENLGNIHAHVQELRVATRDPETGEQQVATLGTHRYLLPGQSSHWHLGQEADWGDAARLDLSAITPRGALNAEIEME
ncbi:molecular chaperone [Alkalilimnicola ehrlichii MLHE-1]|uniref:Putative pili assembly chaperone transmembrane protein n=1 Tax=Alkalilimnicola ehrlichii (strain ATCC BAA-1101 / DSM 17681 / MLHE-1) TaxID=187272 RepID=Q0AAK4_ALKEH|nr:fimbria/pilus periplasmic chaperone [Alkalilimnicola ehrlichii]ABI56133.1 putative pili assembly chaperone transmembrane protein [Alkalilimnicola ehrlichii MLHE-1]